MYNLLNAGFLLFTALVVLWLKPRVERRRLGYTLLAMLALTAVFDPLIVHFDIVRYHADALLGLKWFGAPLEDFAYTLAAVALLPALWERLKRA